MKNLEGAVDIIAGDADDVKVEENEDATQLVSSPHQSSLSNENFWGNYETFGKDVDRFERALKKVDDTGFGQTTRSTYMQRLKQVKDDAETAAKQRRDQGN